MMGTEADTSESTNADEKSPTGNQAEAATTEAHGDETENEGEGHDSDGESEGDGERQEERKGDGERKEERKGDGERKEERKGDGDSDGETKSDGGDDSAPPTLSRLVRERIHRELASRIDPNSRALSDTYSSQLDSQANRLGMLIDRAKPVGVDLSKQHTSVAQALREVERARRALIRSDVISF